MVHPGHPDWVTPALSPSSENRVKMSEIQRSKTKMVIDTDPLPNEEWPRKLDFKIHPGKGCLRRLMKTCRIMRGRKRMGRGALSVLPTAELGVHKGSYQAWFSKIKRCSSQAAELENLPEYVVGIRNICVEEEKEQIQMWRQYQICRNSIHFE